MQYYEGTIENGKLVTKNIKEIDQSKLTSDCWMIQFKGLEACEKCEYKNTNECGGGKTLQSMKKNRKKECLNG